MKENDLKLAKEESWNYRAQTIKDADYADNIVLLANTPAQVKSLLHSLERVTTDIGFKVNVHRRNTRALNQRGDISTRTDGPLKLVKKFTYHEIIDSSNKKDINTWLAGTVTDGLSIIWESDLTDKIKCTFFETVVVSILLYGCITWMQTKGMEKSSTRVLWAVLNKSWRQHPTKQQLHGHLRSITKTVKVRWTRYAGHCWLSKYELISDTLLWTPSHGRAKAGRPARTYIQ